MSAIQRAITELQHRRADLDHAIGLLQRIHAGGRVAGGPPGGAPAPPPGPPRPPPHPPPPPPPDPAPLPHRATAPTVGCL